MKKWIKFKFKNLLWLYGIILVAVIGLLTFLMIKESDPLFLVIGGILITVVFVGVWFAYHYGIRITEKGYLIICNQKMKFFKREEVSCINFYFSKKSDGKCDVIAKVIVIGKSPIEFVWVDFYAKGFNKLKFNVKQSDVEDIIQKLTTDEKITAKFI